MPRLPQELQDYIGSFNADHRPQLHKVLAEFVSKVPTHCGNAYCRRRVGQEYYDGIFFGKRYFFGEKTGKRKAPELKHRYHIRAPRSVIS